MRCLALVSLWCFLACGEQNPAHTSPAAPTPTPTSTPTPRAEAPSTTPLFPTPARIVIINEGSEERVIDKTDGELMSLAIVRLSPDADPRDRPDDANGCRCYCDALESCSDCEPPMQRPHPIAAGGQTTLEWSGLMYHPTQEQRLFCSERYAAPVGEYAVVVCTQEHICGRTNVTLPTQAPIEVRLPAEAPRRVTCNDISAEERTRAARFVRGDAEERFAYEALGNNTVAVEVPECEVRCVESEADMAQANRCIHYLLPRGDRVDSVLAVPGAPVRVSLDVFQTRVVW